MFEIKKIDPFFGSNTGAVNKLNLLREQSENSSYVVAGLGEVSRFSIAQLLARIGGGGGTGIYSAYVKEDAPASDVITCFLDYDGSDYDTWSLREWTVGEILIGTDGKFYRCLTTYTPADATTRPITGTEALYLAKWSVITEIEVYCNISGGGNLADALPRLMAKQPSSYTGDIVGMDWVITTAYSPGDYVNGTNSKEIYVCVTGHTSTVDNRPSSGDHWDDPVAGPYWEIAKREADELLVVKVGDTYKALGLFMASLDGTPYAAPTPPA
jgi:hypothetical protein